MKNRLGKIEEKGCDGGEGGGGIPPLLLLRPRVKLISLTAMVVIISYFSPQFTYMSISYVHFRRVLFGSTVSGWFSWLSFFVFCWEKTDWFD